MFTPSVITDVLNHLDWQMLCTCACVSLSWKDVADNHQRWNVFYATLTAAPSCDQPRALCLSEVSTYEYREVPNPEPEQEQPATPEGLQGSICKQLFRKWWTDHVQLGVLHPVLGNLCSSRTNAAACSVWERSQGVVLPAAVRNFYSINGIDTLVFSMYPTNNSLVIPGGGRPDGLSLKAAPTEYRNIGEHMIKIINENQGCCFWYVIFGPDLPDPPVYLSEHDFDDDGTMLGDEEDEDGSVPQLVLQNWQFSMFWLQYLKEGLEWYRVNGSLDKKTAKVLRRAGAALAEF